MVTSWTAKRFFNLILVLCLNFIPFTSCFSNLRKRKKGELYLVYFTKPITLSYLACRMITQRHTRGAAKYSNTLLLFEKIVYDRPNRFRWILYPESKRMSQNYFYLRSKLTLFIVILVAETDTACTTCTPLSPTECGFLAASHTKSTFTFHNFRTSCCFYEHNLSKKI